MSEKKWKLGDECFIVNIELSTNYSKVEIMPAVITHVGGVLGRNVTATAEQDILDKSTFFIGQPFATEEDARDSIYKQIEILTKSVDTAKTIGSRLVLPAAKSLPNNGDIVYTISYGSKEIKEVVVGVVKYDSFGSDKIRVGYDPSPNNPEVSMVEISRYGGMNNIWKTAETAQNFAREEFGKELPIISRDEVARRADVEIEEILSRAMKNITQSA